jgi:GMP synthase (glutamine-hydrolysing)
MAEVLVLQHIDCEPLGTIEDALRNAGLSFRYVRGYAGQTVPREIGEAPGLIVLGGPMGVYEQDRYPFLGDEMRLIERAVTQGVPTLGVCLGSQLVATALGADVRPGARQEIGWHSVTLTKAASGDRLFRALPSPFMGFHWHGDVFDLPPGAVPLAFSDQTPCQAFRFGPSAYGILFHMEVTAAMIGDWTASFAGELSQAGLAAAPILDALPDYLPSLQAAGRAVFHAWAAQAAGHGPESVSR